MQSTGIVSGQRAADWIFVHVAAQRIERSPRSVRRYAHQGLLTYKREGRRALLVLREDVERLARRGRF